MKHLEKFNWFKKRKEPIVEPVVEPIVEPKRFSPSRETLEDICLELEDLGMLVRIDHGDFWKGVESMAHNASMSIKYGEIWSDKYREGILWMDIKDCILRLKDYLGDNYVNLYYINYLDRLIHIDDHIYHNHRLEMAIEDIKDYERVREINISYII